MSLHDHDRNRNDPYAPPTNRPYEMDSGGGSSKAGLIAGLAVARSVRLHPCRRVDGKRSRGGRRPPAVTAPATDPAANTGREPVGNSAAEHGNGRGRASGGTGTVTC
jgi:hypothetical protein